MQLALFSTTTISVSLIFYFPGPENLIDFYFLRRGRHESRRSLVPEWQTPRRWVGGWVGDWLGGWLVGEVR
jgi:hypothetical protein